MNDLFERFRVLLPPLGPQEEATLSFSQYVGGEVIMLLRLRMQHPGVLERPKHVMSAYQSTLDRPLVPRATISSRVSSPSVEQLALG